jgi:hypothetical protein
MLQHAAMQAKASLFPPPCNRQLFTGSSPQHALQSSTSVCCSHQVVTAWRQHLVRKQRLAAAATRLGPLAQRLQLLAAWQCWRHWVDSAQAADAADLRRLVVQRAVLG